MANTQLDPWRILASAQGKDILQAADAAGAEPSAADIQRIRQAFPDGPVQEALELVKARRRAASKFPDASKLLCDRQGVEQATSHVIAEHKARRFGDLPVLDLCCGIGGDAMSLARRGDTVGVDFSEVRAFMCTHNAGIPVRCEDVTRLSIDMPLVHIDPSRRDEASNRRSWRLEDLQPGLDSITPIVEASQGAALKLGPGIPRDMVPPDPQGTIEFISEGRTLLQAVAWCGSLATPGCARRATDVVAQTSIEGDPQPPPFRGSVGSRLLVPHPAVERAELMSVALGSSDAGELAAGLGILTTDTPTFSPWFEEFEVLEMLPPREEKVRRWLNSYGAGRVVVRSRDKAIDADIWSKKLQGAGDLEVVLFGLRLVRKIVVFATRRVSQPGSSAP